MDGIRPGLFQGFEDSFEAEVAFDRICRTYVVGFVRMPEVRQIFVRLRINGNRLDTELAACLHYPDNDLTTVCYQEFLNHRNLFPSLLRNIPHKRRRMRQPDKEVLRRAAGGVIPAPDLHAPRSP